MKLSKNEKENIEQLINTTEIIYNIYNELSDLETNHQEDELHKKIEYLKTISIIEENILSSFDNNQLLEIISYLTKKNNNKITKRIILKINQILFINKYKYLMSLHNNTLEISVQKGKIRKEYIEKSILDDIENIFSAYLNYHINNTKNEYIRQIWIKHKYNNLFFTINSDSEITNYINNNNIFLSYKYVAQINQIPDIITEELKNKIIIDQLNYHINNLININDLELFNTEEMVKSFIITFYIKAIICLMDNNQIKSLQKSIEKQIHESITKKILTESINDAINGEYKPPIHNVQLYKK